MSKKRYKVTKKNGRFGYYNDINKAIQVARPGERLVDRWTGQAYTVRKGSR